MRATLDVVHQQGNGHSATLRQNGNNDSYGIFQFGNGGSANVAQNGNGQSGITIRASWQAFVRRIEIGRSRTCAHI